MDEGANFTAKACSIEHGCKTSESAHYATGRQQRSVNLVFISNGGFALTPGPSPEQASFFNESLLGRGELGAPAASG